ncbi:MAG: type 1 glutamine amidotransferase [bacterium]|nr:type 1 glutamine amidotransferase [bacterium]
MIKTLKKIHYIQHVPFEDPACILDWAAKNDCEIQGTALYNGESLPEAMDFDLLLIMGGPMSIHDEEEYPWLKQEKMFVKKAIRENKKVIGICLGAQLIAQVLGAKVFQNQHREIGWFPVTSREKFFPETFYAFHWHGETFDIPEGAVHLAENEACTSQAFIYENRVLALQFHLESTGESVEKLLSHCSNELDNSKYVQSPEEIRKTEYLEASNRLMVDILDKMVR